MAVSRPKLSVIIPFFNEGGNVQRIYADLGLLRERLKDACVFEVIFVDNHSSDNSIDLACEIAQRDPEVRVIRLSRNFGYQASILTGFLNCTGDVAVQLDSDGEDDPLLIEQFLAKWREGNEVVYGIRMSRKEKWHITLQRKLFYRLINRISKINMPLDAGDFRLVDRKVVEHMRKFEETTLYLRGIVSYIGFRQTGIPYDRRPRYDGRSKFGWFGAVEFAWHAIAAFSSRPLLYVAYLGVIFSAISITLCPAYAILYYLEVVEFSMFAAMGLALLFFTGIQLFGIGLVGAYVGRIFEEVKRRPRSIIEKVYGAGADAGAYKSESGNGMAQAVLY